MSKQIQIVIDVDGSKATTTIDGVTRSLGELGGKFDDAAPKIKETEKAFESAAKQAASFASSALTIGAIGVEIKRVADAGMQMDAILSRLSVASHNAGAEFAYVAQLANRLGLDVKSAAEQYSSFAVAANGTTLQGDAARKVFEGMATAAAALHMTNEQVGGSLNALQQMISKGKVSAEELNGQLGERMPGALKLAADAMGVTTAELMKQMEQGKLLADDLLPRLADQMLQTYGAAAESATDSARGAFNRLNNAVFDLETKLASGGILNALADIAQGATLFVDNGLKPALWFTQALGVGFGELFQQAALVGEFLSSPSAWFDDKKIAEFDARLSQLAVNREEELTRLAGRMNAVGGVVAGGSAEPTGTAPTSTGTAPDAAAQKKAEAHKKQIDAEIQREADKYDKIIALGNEADYKGAERVSVRLANELRVMDEERARAEAKGAWNAELTAKFEAARTEKIDAAEREATRIVEEQATRREEIERTFAQARLGWVVENQSAQSQFEIATLEADRQRKIDSGVWTLQNEADFAAQKAQIETANFEAAQALKIARETLSLEQDMANFDLQLQTMIDNGTLTDEMQALLDEQRLARAQETSDRLLQIEQQTALKKQQLDNAANRAKMGAMTELDRFSEAMRNNDLQGALDHGVKATANLSKQSRAMFEINKAAALAKAVVSLPSAVMQSFENGGGYPWGLIPAGLMLAEGLANISAIQSASFGGGTSGATAGGGGGGSGAGAASIMPGAPAAAPSPLSSPQQASQPATSVSITVHALDPSQVSDSTLQGIADKLAAPIQQAFSRNGQNTQIMV